MIDTFLSFPVWWLTLCLLGWAGEPMCLVSISLDVVKVFMGGANTIRGCPAYTSVVWVGLVQSVEDL